MSKFARSDCKGFVGVPSLLSLAKQVILRKLKTSLVKCNPIYVKGIPWGYKLLFRDHAKRVVYIKGGRMSMQQFLKAAQGLVDDSEEWSVTSGRVHGLSPNRIRVGEDLPIVTLCDQVDRGTFLDPVTFESLSGRGRVLGTWTLDELSLRDYLSAKYTFVRDIYNVMIEYLKLYCIEIGTVGVNAGVAHVMSELGFDGSPISLIKLISIAPLTTHMRDMQRYAPSLPPIIGVVRSGDHTREFYTPCASDKTKLVKFTLVAGSNTSSALQMVDSVRILDKFDVRHEYISCDPHKIVNMIEDARGHCDDHSKPYCCLHCGVYTTFCPCAHRHHVLEMTGGVQGERFTGAFEPAHDNEGLHIFHKITCDLPNTLYAVTDQVKRTQTLEKTGWRLRDLKMEVDTDPYWVTSGTISICRQWGMTKGAFPPHWWCGDCPLHRCMVRSDVNGIAPVAVDFSAEAYMFREDGDAFEPYVPPSPLIDMSDDVKMLGVAELLALPDSNVFKHANMTARMKTHVRKHLSEMVILNKLVCSCGEFSTLCATGCDHPSCDSGMLDMYPLCRNMRHPRRDYSTEETVTYADMKRSTCKLNCPDHAGHVVRIFIKSPAPIAGAVYLPYNSRWKSVVRLLDSIPKVTGLNQ